LKYYLTVLALDSPSILLHLPLLYAVSPGLRQKVFVDNYQQYGVSFDAFHIHREEILPFPICALRRYNSLVPFLLCLELFIASSGGQNLGLSVLGCLSVKRSVSQNFSIVSSRFLPYLLLVPGPISGVLISIF
jgi:hypothetical protein